MTDGWVNSDSCLQENCKTRLGKPMALVAAVATRWSSQFYMVDRILEVRYIRCVQQLTP